MKCPETKQGGQFVDCDETLLNNHARTNDALIGWNDAACTSIFYDAPIIWPTLINGFLEYYQQSPKEPTNKFGALESLTLTPELKALVFRLNVDL